MERTQGWQEGAAPQGAPHELTPHGRFRAATLGIVGMVVCFGAVVWSGKAWAFDQGVPGQTITESVTLTQDVTAPVGVNGIMIDGDDVVLDGGGHLISGPLGSAGSGDPPWGIYVAPNRRNVVIRNVRVSGFNNAIWLDTGAQDCIVENCQMTASRWHGVALAGGSGNIVRNCTAQYNHRGIELRGQAHHDTIVEGNVVENNSEGGIALYTDATPVSTAVTIRNNLVRYNGSYETGGAGITLDGTAGHSGSVVSGNTVTGNYNGILVGSSQGALVEGNTITESVSVGFQVGTATDTTLRGNRICGSGWLRDVWPVWGAVRTYGENNTCDYALWFHDAGSYGCTACCNPASGDTTPPTAPVVSDDRFVSFDTWARFAATDAESGILDFQCAIGSSPGSDDTHKWTSSRGYTGASVGTDVMTEGATYYWSVAARNRACLWSEVGVSDGFIVDKTPPTVTILSPAPGATVRGVLTLRASVSDTVSGVASVTFWVEDGSYREFRVTSPPYEASLETRGLYVPDGQYSLRIRTDDLAGNSEWAGPVPFKIRNATFDDVAKSHTFWRYVEALVDATVTSGCNASPPLYCPNNPVKRDQMAKLLCAAAGKTRLDATTPTFADVPKTHQFYGCIERLADAASWGGNPPTSGCKVVGTARYYCPNENVTRAQMAKFLCIATGKTWLGRATPTFSDVPTSHTFYGWIERLAHAASWGGTAPTSGCTATKYCPDASVHRDQMAKFLVLAFGLPYYEG